VLDTTTVETQHLLLGLLTEGNGLSAGILSARRLSLDLIRDYIGADTATRRILSSIEGSLSDESKRALTYAAREAEDFTSVDFIDAEHLLLGLLREEGGLAATILRCHGVTLSESRDVVREKNDAFCFIVDSDVSSEQLFTMLTALADYFRSLGGAALTLDDFELQAARSRSEDPSRPDAPVLWRYTVRLRAVLARDWWGYAGASFRRTLAAEHEFTRRNLRSWERTNRIPELEWKRVAGIGSIRHREAVHAFAREELTRLEREQRRRSSVGEPRNDTVSMEGVLADRTADIRVGEARLFQTLHEANLSFGIDCRGTLRIGHLEADMDGEVVRSRRLDLQIEFGGDRRVDSFTGLPRLRAFESELDRLLATPTQRGETVTVIATDIDGFKEINDNFGCHAGDEVLIAVARILESHRAQEDTIVARVGGDEFLLAFGPRTDAQAHAFAALIRHDVGSLTVSWQNRSIGPISASFGLAFSPLDGRRPRELIDAAFQALRGGKPGDDDLPPSPDSVAAFPRKPRPLTDASVRIQRRRIFVPRKSGH
jgi:diguanylate cyclase (GGDEF)-like protein